LLGPKRVATVSTNSNHSSAPGVVHLTTAPTAVSPYRAKTFSLLSYSFNLDPAIRNEVLFSGLHNYDRLHILMVSFFATDWRGDRFCGIGFRALHEGQ
jgi:hypothetical protein